VAGILAAEQGAAGLAAMPAARRVAAAGAAFPGMALMS